jgi:hypothetical protein
MALAGDLQSRILNAPSLNLYDLARVGPASKIFSESYKLHRDAEEQWLDNAAIAAFGQDLIMLVGRWLIPAPPRPSWGRVLHVQSGQPWPLALQGPLAVYREIWLEVPGWGTNVGNTVTFILYSGHTWRGIGLETHGPNPMWFRCDCEARKSMEVDIIHPASEPSQLVAILGLVGHALRHVAALGAAVGQHSQRTFRFHGGPHVDHLGWYSIKWAPQDVQRALIVVRMLAYRVQSSLPSVNLFW